MSKAPEEQLAMALATLEVVADNFRYHTERCGVCAGSFRCQTAAYWNNRSVAALDDVEALQQQLRRATLAAAR